MILPCRMIHTYVFFILLYSFRYISSIRSCPEIFLKIKKDELKNGTLITTSPAITPRLLSVTFPHKMDLDLDVGWHSRQIGICNIYVANYQEYDVPLPLCRARQDLQALNVHYAADHTW